MSWRSAWHSYTCLLLTRGMMCTLRVRRRAATVRETAPQQRNCPVPFRPILKAWSVQSHTIKPSRAASSSFIVPLVIKKNLSYCFYQTRSHSESDIRPRPKSCKVLIFSVLLLLNSLQNQFLLSELCLLYRYSNIGLLILQDS